MSLNYGVDFSRSISQGTRAVNETAAFTQARLQFEQNLLYPTIDRSPKRLYDIYTGQFTEDTSNKPYVIASYIWHPEALPQFPKCGSYTTDAFEEMVNLAAKEKNVNGESLLEIDRDFKKRLCDFKFPDFRCDANIGSYFREVFALLAAEAAHRGVKYVWMDSLCIDQADPSEKAEEIPRMAEYYSQAVCCVVVSEMLRRGYSHSWKDRGKDTLAERLKFGHSDQNEIDAAYQERWGIQDELVGWIIGFHELRLWVFQETYHAQDLVHRGRNICINSRAVLYPGEPVDKPDYPPGTQWHRIGEAQKSRALLWMRQTYLDSVRYRLPFLPPTWNIFKNSLDADEYLRVVWDQRRGVSKPQDEVYGMLSLYPKQVRTSLPIKYNISKIAVYAILMYLRVCSGEIEALLPAEEHPRRGSHLIQIAPSWLPKHYTKGVFSPTLIRFSEISVTTDHSLNIQAPFLNISEVSIQLSQTTGEDQASPQNAVILVRPAFPRVSSQKDVAYKWEKFRSFVVSDSGKETYLYEQELQKAVRQGNVIMTCLGAHSVERINGYSELIWMVLTSSNDRKTWVKRGWVETDNILDFSRPLKNLQIFGCYDKFIIN
jgi:hypothetical protein